MVASGEMAQAVGITALRLAWGFCLGAAAGTLLGALCGASALARALLDPLVQALRSVPSLAWVPLFILWLGIFEASKITLIAVGVFFPVYLNLSSGHRQRGPQIAGSRRGASLFSPASPRAHSSTRRPTRLYHWPARRASAWGWMFVSAAELLGASSGLGFILDDGEQTGRPERVLVAILLFGLCGKLTDVALAAVGKRLVAWQDTAPV